MRKPYGIFQRIWKPIIAILVGAVFLFPLYWMLATSFKSQVEIFQSPITLFPHTFRLEAYTAIFKDPSIYSGFINSAIISISTMIIATVLAIPAAYGLARFQLKGKKVMIMLFLVTQMLPATLVLTPLYLMFHKVGLLNSYWAPILADTTIGLPFSVLILRTYFVSIPKELDEAAKIDGCGHLSSFFRIMLPVARSGVVVAAVFSFIYAWGDLIYGLTFMTDPLLRPVTSGIYNYIQQYATSWNRMMAFGFISILPVVLIFIFMQKYIVAGLTSGAVKS